jgi:excisionase family DNA binding protein
MEPNELSVPSEKINDGPRFITIAELMVRTTLSRPTIHRMIKKGAIPVVRIGRRTVVDIEFLQELKAKGRVSTQSKEAM